MEKLKPEVSKDEVKSLIYQYYGLTVDEVKELNGYDDCNFYCCYRKTDGQEKDLIEMNFKVTNYKDTEEENLLEAMNDLSLYVHQSGINVPIPIQNLNKNYLERIQLKNESKRRNAIRLFTFIPGILFSKVNYTENLLSKCGREFAKLNKILSNYSNEAIEKRTAFWALENAVLIEEYLDELEDLNQKTIVQQVLNEFKAEVLDKRDQFRQAIIHDDLNEQNIILKRDSTNLDYEIAAILDFNDSGRSIRIFDIAIFCAYSMLNSKCSIKFIDMPKYILKGYCSNIDVNEPEMNIIPICIKTRLCQSLVLGAHFYKLDPTNEYQLETSKTGWPILVELFKIPNSELIKMWI